MSDRRLDRRTIYRLVASLVAAAAMLPPIGHDAAAPARANEAAWDALRAGGKEDNDRAM